MLESGVANCQQHVGLQKLSTLARMLHSSLGPNKRYKFIQDESSGESALACSCFRIIQNLEPTCAVGQLVYETVQAQQKVYHTGSGCLLFLAGAWSRVALDCLQKGISVTHIISAMTEGMEICMDVCRKSVISIQDLAARSPGRRTTTTPAPGPQLPEKPFTETAAVDQKTLDISGKRKVKLSRHFCENKSDVILNGQQLHHPEHPDMERIAEALSHGCDNTMKLAVEAVHMQSQSTGRDLSCPSFDITRLVTCVLPCLSEDHACVVQGCVVLLSDDQAPVAHLLKERPLNVVLIQGDLSQSYRHLGFKKPAGVQRVSNQLDLSSREDEWVEKVMELLSELGVNLILVTGFASESVIRRCCRRHILVVEKFSSSVLRTFASSTGAVPVTYATQLNERCVGVGGLRVGIWRDLSSYDRKSLTAVNISTGGKNIGLVTVILTSCVHGKLQALEDQFWACAYRLHHALTDKALLPGAGGTEILCIHHLQKRAEHHRKNGGDSGERTKTGTASNLYGGVVLQLMADSFLDYVTTVTVNTGRLSGVEARTAVSQQLQNFSGCREFASAFSRLVLEGDKEAATVFSAIKPDETPTAEIWDNLSVKQEAWRKALDLVFLVLQTDAEVITGVGQKTEENLMLL
ncbi:Bardet-Biedl syndrome 12 protein [Cololabis saira]|uniref:Bardet-Biedl syndrome 12 protein n=1 Tax=Cololabis saira TaxID=129043 RepID=UPI002AD4DF58|nr:Bardet-Biedl syndrome 12 protein [Cololabis saira]